MVAQLFGLFEAGHVRFRWTESRGGGSTRSCLLYSYYTELAMLVAQPKVCPRVETR